jgi:uncharacterized membrane protein YhaH (DUF805 family)
LTNSKQIAGLLGPTFIALAITESMNLPIWANTPAPLVYLSGTLLFVTGLSIVRVHNRWTEGWPVLVTLMGWLAMLGGLIRMIAPVFAQQRTEQNTTAVYALLIVLLTIGIFLTFKAYSREESKTAVHARRAR